MTSATSQASDKVVAHPRHGPEDSLPAVPEKRYFTIGEVARLCAVKPHVLRYWEQEFPQLKPSKRRGNRRYYQREDVHTIRQIRHLLYDEGFTISGARQHLAEILAIEHNRSRPEPKTLPQALHEIRTELEALLAALDRLR